ncbi:MAG: transcriptional repressor [Paludibacteraceae bacterium]|jgi:Fur family ferric uptake transcriptional regulator|nr:transcriptional repressor [Paludibacteraceae bacterium]
MPNKKADDIYRHAYDLLCDYIDRNGLRHTAERMTILASVCGLQSFSVDELRAHLTEITISRATVYNALTLMEKAGIVHRLDKDFGKRSVFYELIFVQQSSVKVICRNCGRISEVKDSTIQRMLEDKNFTNFVQERFSLYVYGHCKVCRRKAMKNLKSK